MEEGRGEEKDAPSKNIVVSSCIASLLGGAFTIPLLVDAFPFTGLRSKKLGACNVGVDGWVGGGFLREGVS